jgi:hypothetical protein
MSDSHINVDKYSAEWSSDALNEVILSPKVVNNSSIFLDSAKKMEEPLLSISIAKRWLLAICPKKHTVALAPVILGWSFATSTNWFHDVSFGCSFSEWLIQISTSHVNEVFDRKAAERKFILMVVAVYPVPVLLLVKDLAFP